jgi:drug/metabolite transporter (DMT)-like permease
MTDERRAVLFLVISAAGFGGTWVAAPWATDEIQPLTVACLRFAIAALTLLAWCRIRGIPTTLSRADLPLVVGVAATSVVGYNVLFLYGVTLAPASHGAVIVPGLIPMATLLLGRAALGARASARQVGGVALSIAGLALVVGPALGGSDTAPLGDLLFAISAAVWAVYTLIGRAATVRVDPAVLTLFGTALGAAAFVPLALAAPGGPGNLGDAGVRALASVVYLGSIGTVVSFVAFLQGVRLIGAARASAFTVLIPVFGLSLTVTLLGEPLTPLALVGAGVVLVGLRITQLAGRGPAAAPEPMIPTEPA